MPHRVDSVWWAGNLIGSVDLLVSQSVKRNAVAFWKVD